MKKSRLKGAPKWLVLRSVSAAQTGARMLENLGYEGTSSLLVA